MDFQIKRGQALTIAVSEGESEAVQIALSNLEADLQKVFGKLEIRRAAPGGQTDGKAAGEPAEESTPVILVGTIDRTGAAVGAEAEGLSADTAAALTDTDRLQTDKGLYRKEAYLLRVRDGQLHIVGTDRRGTVYGIYDLCRQIGVSPWYFWADVPVKEKRSFCLPEGYEKAEYPSVEYRGIFINDEEELDRWVKAHMGEKTIGLRTYEKVFELLLRLGGNYIWPAMHVNSFNADPQNGALAHRMGIVVGTSHCDMLMRSNNREWRPWLEKKGYEGAAYDYSLEGRNREILQEYWQESVEQNRDFEVCYTLGMRGIHDSGFETDALAGMPEEARRQEKIRLLERIIRDQRAILDRTLGHETMMTFIPYKEVLELYDAGLAVPEDITLVWANDNYGYIRRYPSEKEKGRRGGNGIYYHNSYWAPPSMSYVFFCSIPLAHTGNELRKAYAEGIRKLWVLNCGALKPLEMEIEFFLRLAWEIGKEEELTADVDAYVADWIDRNFSGGIGAQTASLLNRFSQLVNVRKVENMDNGAFSQTAYGDEAAGQVHRLEEMFAQGNALYERLPEAERDAFFQLVLMRLHAAYFTSLQYYYADRSTLCFAEKKNQAAAHYVRKYRQFEDARTAMLRYYNRIMSGGKWDGILDPEGFPPPRTAMLPVCTPPLPRTAMLPVCTPPLLRTGGPSQAMGRTTELRVDVWNGGTELIFSHPGEKWIEIGNTGGGLLEYEVRFPGWLTLTTEQEASDGPAVEVGRIGSDAVTKAEETACLRGSLRTERRLCFFVAAIQGLEGREGQILIREQKTGNVVRVPVRIDAWEDADSKENEGVVREEDGLVVLEADRATSPAFRVIRRLGRGTGNLVEAKKGCTQASQPLSYPFWVKNGGSFLLELQRFPSLNSTGRLRIGAALDGGPVRILESFSNDEWKGNWRENVLHNVDRLWWELPFLAAGRHVLQLYAVDSYFAFSRILIYTAPYQKNDLAGLWGRQPLPKEFDVGSWCRTFYGCYERTTRPLYCALPEREKDDLGLTAAILPKKREEGPIEAKRYWERGRRIFEEASGKLLIDAATALAQSDYARTEGQNWRHCQSESYAQSGIALYVPGKELLEFLGENGSIAEVAGQEAVGQGTAGQEAVGQGTAGQEAVGQKNAALCYRLCVTGGDYTFWMLTKFNGKENSYYGLAIDSVSVPPDRLYGRGCLWRYEAEQVWRWVPVARIALKAGEHELRIESRCCGLRFDRFCLIKE